jgi:hypothetical protein
MTIQMNRYTETPRVFMKHFEYTQISDSFFLKQSIRSSALLISIFFSDMIFLVHLPLT